MTKKIWALIDDRTGNVSQCLGVAEGLGLPFETKQVYYNRLAKLPNCLLGASLLGVDHSKSDSLQGEWPDAVIAAGRRTAPIARWIKKQSKGKTKLVQLMWPGNPAKDFDLIAVPEHDGITPHGNIVTTVGAPHRITKEKMEQSAKDWQERFAEFPAPRVAMLVGGSTKEKTFTKEQAALLGSTASKMAAENNGSLLITTSRRTSAEAAAALRENITCPHYFHDINEKDNPYLAMLGLADQIIVTGESMSMCSEACATGKPVFVFDSQELVSTKHASFHKTLYQHHFAYPLLAEVGEWSDTPLDTVSDICRIIQERVLA